MSNSNLGLSFGVASIDALIDPENLCYRSNDNAIGDEVQKPVVACIAGPDGVGKSILALSAASTFASTQPELGRVVYASTDFNYAQASKAWECFGFGKPKARFEELMKFQDRLCLPEKQKLTLSLKQPTIEACELVWLSPFADFASTTLGKLKPYGELFVDSSKANSSNEACVYLLDLASYSAGDDWSLINHTVGLLIGQFPSGQKRNNLLIVDAVEGLEAMAGDRDRFGLVRSRRSRLAQLVRLARKANCHVIFVIEQGDADAHLDEVFVSDLVIKLRSEKIDGYMQKTIEVEKVRGTLHVRGMHELQLRNGSGGSSDGWITPDDPRIPFENSSKTLSYLQVIPSLHVKNRVAATTC